MWAARHLHTQLIDGSLNLVHLILRPLPAACWPQRVAHPGSPTLRRGEIQQIGLLAWLFQSS